jgi:cyclohexadieny/prephenate dehydrogenase
MGRDVIQYAGSSFRDLTRVAASDPIMWRDIFLTNRDAVLDILQRFKKDLAALEREVAAGDGEALKARFEHGRAIRRGVAGRRLVEPPVLITEKA